MNAEGNLGRTDGLKAQNVRPLVRIYVPNVFAFLIILAVATARVNTKIINTSPTIRENRGVFILNISNHTI